MQSKTGFATMQSAYEEAVTPRFETFNWLRDLLSTPRYLMGAHLRGAGWHLFRTLIRFDPAYAGHFKCNLSRIADYSHLSGYVRDLYQHSGIAEIVDLSYIRKHYYSSHEAGNPTCVVSTGLIADYAAPHDRAQFSKDI